MGDYVDDEDYLCPRCGTKPINIANETYSLDEREIEQLKEIVEIFSELSHKNVDELISYARLMADGETLNEVE